MAGKFKFEDPRFEDPPTEGGAVQYEPAARAASSRAGAALRRYSDRLMMIPGVKSVGEGRGAVGEPSIEVGVAHSGVIKDLPKRLDGIEVVARVIGEVDAYAER
ncbi:MAG TPA: hypothetical protein VF170_00165 [Planctomycetaceae bacterium]